MDINRALANMDDDDEIPQHPQDSGFVAMDKFFEAGDYGIQEAATDELTMRLPLGKVAKVSRARLRSCKTDAELRQLDRLLYAEAGLNPADFGL